MDQKIIQELIISLNENTKVKKLETEVIFLTQKDLREKLGWGKNTVAEMFNRPDFPAIELGKEKVVEVSAFKEWAKCRRER